MQRFANERVLVQVGLLVTAMALYASTFSQNFSSSDVAQSPMFFPRVILVLWIALGVIALIQSIRANERSKPIESWGRIAIVVIAGCASHVGLDFPEVPLAIVRFF